MCNELTFSCRTMQTSPWGQIVNYFLQEVVYLNCNFRCYIVFCAADTGETHDEGQIEFPPSCARRCFKFHIKRPRVKSLVVSFCLLMIDIILMTKQVSAFVMFGGGSGALTVYGAVSDALLPQGLRSPQLPLFIN